VERCCEGALWRSVMKQSCLEVLWGNVVGKLQRSVVKEKCGEVLWRMRSVVEECCKEAIERSFVKKRWR